MINRKHFFDTIRTALFAGSINQSQVEGMESIICVWETGGYKDLRWLAYILATTFHETGQTMQPVRELGKGKGYPYGKMLKRGGGPGKRIPYSTPQQIYYGRGYVQLTWYENYESMGRLLSIDLLNNPDLALQPVIASKIMFEGMTNGNSHFGDFTGLSLENFFNDKKCDWVNARKIINGLDCASKIAGYAKLFYEAVKEPVIQEAEKAIQ